MRINGQSLQQAEAARRLAVWLLRGRLAESADAGRPISRLRADDSGR
jgi:hypothetical protein